MLLNLVNLIELYVGIICYRIEIEENVINGSFNMMFLGHSLSLGYRNHTNIAMRYFIWFVGGYMISFGFCDASTMYRRIIYDLSLFQKIKSSLSFVSSFSMSLFVM